MNECSASWLRNNLGVLSEYLIKVCGWDCD